MTYDAWVASTSAGADEVPKGFGESDIVKEGGIKDVIGGSGDDWKGKQKVVRPGREEAEKPKLALPKVVSLEIWTGGGTRVS